MTAALEGGEWSAARPGRTLQLVQTDVYLQDVRFCQECCCTIISSNICSQHRFPPQSFCTESYVCDFFLCLEPLHKIIQQGSLVFNLKLNPQTNLLQPITKNRSTKMNNKFFEGMAKFRCLIFIMEYKLKTPQFFLFVEEIITQSHRTLRITNSWIKYHC